MPRFWRRIGIRLTAASKHRAEWSKSSGSGQSQEDPFGIASMPQGYSLYGFGKRTSRILPASSFSKAHSSGTLRTGNWASPRDCSRHDVGNVRRHESGRGTPLACGQITATYRRSSPHARFAIVPVLPSPLLPGHAGDTPFNRCNLFTITPSTI